MIADGHIHTPFCPHGTSDKFEEYIEWFIQQKAEEISFTEHAPLPEGFVDTTPSQDSGMSLDLLPLYIDQLQKIKEKYKNKIKVNIGLEIDYIEGFENKTTDFLKKYGPMLDDSILSVHFLKKDHNYYCMDYSADYFGDIVEEFGSVSKVYEKYYDTIKKSIMADLGPHKPKRLGHITLVHKFQLKFPNKKSFKLQETALLHLIKKNNLALDYNGAGTAKPFCLEVYPNKEIVEQAISLGIPLIYGSDAHKVSDLGQGYSHLHPKAILTRPSKLYSK